MIKGCGRPARCLVAVFACVASCKVHGRFTGGFSSIVTTEAARCDSSVDKFCRGPAGGLMAIFADIAGRKVRRRFTSGFSSIVT